MKKSLFSLILILFTTIAGFAQENSPYTRYALGDLVPNTNIISRAMGGVSAAYFDTSVIDRRFSASINATNPATYGFSRMTGGKKGRGGLFTVDAGVDASSRTLKELGTNKKYTSSYGMLSYLNIGMPIKKGWGINIGFAPETRINYKLFYNERLSGIDSVRTTYSGNGGVYKVFVGSGWKIKNFGVGFNVGYLFGERETDTRRDFINDSVTYYSADYNTNTSFGNVFANIGVYHSFQLNKAAVAGNKKKSELWLRLGAYAQIQPELKGSQDIKRETQYIAPSGIVTTDTIAIQQGISGNVKYPSTYGFGFVIEKSLKWMAGMDVVMSNWADYRFYNTKDLTANTYQVKIGGQYTPDFASTKMFRRMAYRAGFNFGTEPYSFNGQQLQQFSATVGLGLPLRNRSSYYQNSLSTLLNLSFEFGTRGKTTDVIKENFFRVGIGLSLSDWWFVKAKYY